jgi:HSP20 family protein
VSSVERKSLAPPHLAAQADGRDPHVDEKRDAGRAEFEPAAHRYDCSMPQRRKDIERLKSEMEELFADLCQVPRLVGSRSGFRPAVDVYRTDDPPAVTVVVELAGVDPAETELAFADGVLVVRGTRRRLAGERRFYQHIEIDYGPFERRVPIPDFVDADAAEASYARGLLVIELPVRQRAPKRVRVTIEAKGTP